MNGDIRRVVVDRVVICGASGDHRLLRRAVTDAVRAVAAPGGGGPKPSRTDGLPSRIGAEVEASVRRRLGRP